MTKRILVIEDDDDIRTDIFSLLTEEGYQVTACQNGNINLDIISAESFDLIISDIMMTGLDGYDLLSALHNQFNPSAVPPFIFLTAKVERADMRKGMELGADDYITKPFKASELLSAINIQISKRKGLEENSLISGKHKEVAPQNSTNSSGHSMAYSESIFIDSNSGTMMLKIKDISYISADGDYTSIVTSDAHHFMIRKSMNSWLNLLPPEYFLRIHRSKIINKEFIIKIEKWFNYTYRVYLRTVQEPFTVSQRISRELRKQIKNS